MSFNLKLIITTVYALHMWIKNIFAYVYTVKKVERFFVPRQDVTYKTLPGRKKLNYSRPGRVGYSNIPAGDGKIANLFYSVLAAPNPVYFICITIHNTNVNPLQGPMLRNSHESSLHGVTDLDHDLTLIMHWPWSCTDLDLRDAHCLVLHHELLNLSPQRLCLSPRCLNIFAGNQTSCVPCSP